MSTKAIYFKNLNGLRFIAAFSVLLAHIELLKSLHGYSNINDLAFYKNTNGHIGVILFFVLSGFLITYLLLKEESDHKSISLKRFYIRRILRIWPLYFLMVCISFLVYTLKGSVFGEGGWWGYFSIFPNVSKALGYYYDGVVHLWSIGVEEQFYLIWPILLMITKKLFKIRLPILILIFIGFSFLPHLLWFVQSHFHLFSEQSFQFLDRFTKMFKINCMAFGGIVGYFIFIKKRFRLLENKTVRQFLFFIPFIMWYSGVHFSNFTDEIYTVLFGVILYCFAVYDSTINLEYRWLNFLGKISYGIYVYHWLVILMMFKCLSYFEIENNILINLIIYLGTIGVTFLMAYLSYNYFEKFFLKIKVKFE